MVMQGYQEGEFFFFFFDGFTSFTYDFFHHIEVLWFPKYPWKLHIII